MAAEYIDRPPRIQPELPIDERQVPSPPNAADKNRGDMVSQLLPMLSVLSMVGLGAFAGSGNIAGSALMGGVMLLSVSGSLYQVWKDRQNAGEASKRYLETLKQMRKDMADTHNTQRIFYAHNYPDVSTVLNIAAYKEPGQETSRFGTRLWERRTSDHDFGVIRLGMGTRNSTVVYTFGDSNGENPLARDAARLAADSRVLKDAPVTITLKGKSEKLVQSSSEDDKEPQVHGAPQHAIGIYGKNRGQVADFARAMLASYTAFHSPVDTRVYALGHSGRKADWKFAEWLPHVDTRGVGDDDDNADERSYDQLCFEDDTDALAAFWRPIKKDLDQRQLRLNEKKDGDGAGVDVTLPLHVVFVDLLGELPADSPLKDITGDGMVNRIVGSGPMLGAAIIFLANDPSQLPSDCGAMIEVGSVGERVVFRYAETGLNPARYLGDADQLDQRTAQMQFAAKIRRLDLQRPFGSDLPRAATLLQMQSMVERERIDSVDRLPIARNWQVSVDPRAQEWLSVPVGMMSMRDVRTMVFSAKEGGDGVHGMVAGTTGSGKSEMLMTLIAGMAIKYDPRVVNFVLVDYKGGQAFEAFRRLPHTVDILTNLQPNAVERMFIAIQAVMDQRAELLAQSGVSDLVKYRAEVAPKLTPDDPRPRTFPHLFIIVDEFAEMIAANPDYKQKFESITRLGRAFGVSLILATQRPAGAVTDQMRANMKFKISLRVETTDDSKELLESPEAAFLPNLGGRGYIKSGNDLMQGVQVAWAGEKYTGKPKLQLKDIYWLEEEALPDLNKLEGALYTPGEIAQALALEEPPRVLLDWVVGATAVQSRRLNVPAQTKPWPDPLPEQLTMTGAIDARYLNTERDLGQDKRIVVDATVGKWLEEPTAVSSGSAGATWPAFNWKSPTPLRVDIGLIDNPYRSENRLLTIDIGAGPTVLFGAAGRGKTTFVKSLLVALGATRSPNELHMYALDFGRGGLKSVQSLPHLGASIDASESARVDQLLRMLRNFINERQEQLGKSPYGTLNEYNANTPQNIYPDIVVVIDNFAEFRDSYDHLSADLLSLIRDGRQFGVHFVLTAGVLNEIGMKLIGMFANRLTLSQADSSAVSDVVGSGARPFDNVPGRGMLAVAIKDGDKPVPLEFHVALPGEYEPPAPGMEPQERAALLAQNAERQNQAYVTISRNMEAEAVRLGIKRPAAELPKSLTFFDMWSKIDKREIKTIAELDLATKWRASMEPENSEWLRGAIGLVSDKDVKHMVFQAQADGVHGMAAGTTGSGKSELLQTLIASMALKYDPRIVNFVLIDYKGGPTVEPFKRLPHSVDIATNLDGNAVERIFIAIDAEMNRRSAILAKAGVSDLVEYRKKVIPTLKPDSPFPRTFPHLFIIVDEFGEMMTQNSDYRGKFESITRLGRSFGVSLILATQRPSGVVSDQMRANMKFRISLRVETPQDSKELLNRPDAARLPQIAGRGYVQAGTDLLTEVQAAWSGAPYAGDAPDSPYAATKVIESMGGADAPRSLLGWVVGAMQLEAQRGEIPKQTKPWPDPMPNVLPINEPIDATYMPEPGATKDSISARRVRQTVLSPALAQWIDNKDGKPLWQRWDWRDKLPMTATFGVIDNPFAAEQMPLSINAAEPLLVFGASGRGKTTFLKSMLFALAAERSPAELNIYAIDFGRGGLKTLSALPHCGAAIDAARADRIEALFRMLKGIINERQERLAKFPSLEDYNAQHKDNPEALFPAIVFAIDNFVEFKENFEYLLPDLMSMVRDGRQFGISFVITASVLNDLGNKLANLFTQKLCFTVSGGDYSDIVGRPPLPLTDVPGRGYVPVNIENRPVALEFHVATPVIEGERDPYMRIAERMGAASDAAGMKRPSAEIPKSVTLLEMLQAIRLKKTERIGEIGIADNWRASMLPENQDWLRADIGFVSSKELRSLYFTAKAGGDGVHGLAAGTTGSGKSELIQTLITSMALRYDPRIVNFVLIDYKGGPTVEPFRQLPHAVDIATNLDGNAVDRIFVAIGAEMNRRSAILAKAGVADLVEYRKKVIPTLKPDSPLPRTFPHLFVIVDEFAEMITNNPDYKAKFDSITRLGRSFGVSLILATQKPSGVVTDQMKANMKFRLCLRVETADDSKELLNRPDAATLPSLGGRGYLQVGGGPLTEVQAAWSGAPYDETRPDPAYPTPEILGAMGKEDDPPRSLLGWVVGALQLEAQRQQIGKQFKPWPDLLPPVIQLHGSFDASYIPALRDKGQKQVIINEQVAAWIAAGDGQAAPGWTPHDYSKKLLLKTSVGIVDNTYEAEQQLFEVDLTADPLLIMGASGRGKSTFIKSLVSALCAKYSPSELHVYGLDLARGGLKSLRNLPHVGGIIDGNDEDRVERLFRMAFNLINDRQRKLAAYDDFDDYNAKNPQTPLPSVLIVIDNVAEFRETYDKYLGDLIALLRDGRSFGLYFAMAGALVADVPGKVFSLIPQRITFYQSDPSTYQDILGKRGGNIPDVNGRGLLLGDVGGQPFPLEFHAAIAQDEKGADLTRELGNRMRAVWEARVQDEPALRSRAPKSVEPLATQIDIGDLLLKADSATLPPAIAIGINDNDREPTTFETAKSAHLLLLGPPMSGKTTAMRSIMLALAHAYPPERLGIVVADPSDSARRFFNYGAANGANLTQLPHVLAQVTNGREMDDLILHLMAEYDEMTQIKLRKETDLTYAAIDNTKRAIVVLIDHADDIEALNKGSKHGGITALAEIGKGKNLHFVMAGSLEILRAGSTELRKRVESARQALVLQDIDTVRFMGPRGPFTSKEMPAGRGYLVRGLTATLTQVAMPALDSRDGRNSDDVLAERIQAIVHRHADNMARWGYFAKDLVPLAELIYGQKQKDGSSTAPAVNGEAAVYDSTYRAEESDVSQELLDMDALLGGMEVVMPDAPNMAKWEIPEGSVADEDLNQKAAAATNQQDKNGGAA